jgi:hypothetical protein
MLHARLLIVHDICSAVEEMNVFARSLAELAADPKVPPRLAIKFLHESLWPILSDWLRNVAKLSSGQQAC